ncbi:MAG TPA: RluA family pseudouridine synthase [Candidatus Hydrogenedentes bacterium]|nr:RluA family pseudouridine synthase [Candidatus Hydrogenedentota bacterium]HOS03898.1 RluA family pseudouridine synthase [Candidatus Hydrogenedentota bacterium]
MPKVAKPSGRHKPQGLDILYEDRDILVVDKAPGLLTMGTDSEKTRTAYYRLTDYVRKGCARSRNRIFIVHRLDREVSGVLVFAKTLEAKESLQSQWEEVEKKYLAVVHGRLPDKAGVISSYLAESRTLAVHSTDDATRGKLSRTAYRVLKETPRFSLLEITLLTGRKHQIRVHLAEIGHPIVGDDKYGRKDPAQKRIALHATSIAFIHPSTGEPVAFESEAPAYFHMPQRLDP